MLQALCTTRYAACHPIKTQKLTDYSVSVHECTSFLEVQVRNRVGDLLQVQLNHLLLRMAHPQRQSGHSALFREAFSGRTDPCLILLNAQHFANNSVRELVSTPVTH